MSGQDSTSVNREYYDRVSPGQRDYWKKMAAARHRVAVFTDVVCDRRPNALVDLGCGSGVLLTALHEALPAMRLAGIDLAKAQVDENTRFLPWASFLSWNLQTPLDAGLWEGTFDFATASEVIEHLDEPVRLLENARKLLAPGGRVMVSTQSGPVRKTEQIVGHRRHFTAREVTELLESAGLVAEHVWNTGFPFHDLSKWYANLNPERSMKEFGDGAYGMKQNVICAALRLAFRLNSTSRGAQLFAIGRRP